MDGFCGRKDVSFRGRGEGGRFRNSARVMHSGCKRVKLRGDRREYIYKYVVACCGYLKVYSNPCHRQSFSTLICVVLDFQNNKPACNKEHLACDTVLRLRLYIGCYTYRPFIHEHFVSVSQCFVHAKQMHHYAPHMNLQLGLWCCVLCGDSSSLNKCNVMHIVHSPAYMP